jgi:predicted transcriptional regulator of viral defense system
MNFWQLRKQFIDLLCFNANQVYAWQADFDKNNLTRWTKQGLLVKLRNGFYSFPEHAKIPNIQYFVSNRIYCPSYISLHSALAFYDIIPEAVIKTTAVGTLKKANFENAFGQFSYQKILPELMFGYEQKSFENGRTIFFATPEKAILDLLYLYPFYNNEQEISELRFNEDFMQDDLNTEQLNEFCDKFKSKALEKRVKILSNAYH